ncbi:MAG: ABC transporter ATP-binding protein [Anaerolineales bacterium]
MGTILWKASPLCCIGIFVLMLLQGVLPLAIAWIAKLIFDLLAHSLTGSIGIPPELWTLLGLQVGVSVLSQVLQPLGGFLNSELTRQITINTQNDIFKKLVGMEGLASFENPQNYNLIQMAVQGAQFGPQQLLFLGADILRNVSTLIAFMGLLFSFNPILAGIVTVATLPQLFIQWKIGSQHLGLLFQNTPKERRAAYMGFILSGASFAKELRLLNLGDYFLGLFNKLYREIFHTQRNQQSREIVSNTALYTLSSLISGGAFVYTAVQAFAGKLSLGDATLYLNAVSSVQGAFSGITYSLANLNEGILFFNQYQELVDLPQTIAISTTALRMPPLRKGLEIRNVSLRYSEQLPWVLHDINLTIPVGQSLALVGLNGAGKTTLVKLLTRIYDPLEGRILWDGTDIRELDPKEYRQRIRAVFQDFVRYELSARENIGLGDVSALSDEKWIRTAAQQAGIDSTILNLPQKYDTILSRWLAEDGQGIDLSGGEW